MMWPLESSIERRLKSRIESTLNGIPFSPEAKTQRAVNSLASGIPGNDLSRVNKKKFLKWTFEKLTIGAETATDAIMRVIKFSAEHFFHHFTTQPIDCSGILITDPITALWLGVGQCTTINRACVDIIEAGGFKVALLEAAHHIVGLVELQGKWRIVDPDVFGQHCGVTQDGQLTSLSDALDDPFLLDTYPAFQDHTDSQLRLFFKQYPDSERQISLSAYNYPLCSSVYFGARPSDSELGSTLKIHRRNTSSQKSNDYGWYATAVEAVRAPTVPMSFRPAPLILRDNRLIQLETIPSGQALTYQVLPLDSSCYNLTDDKHDTIYPCHKSTVEQVEEFIRSSSGLFRIVTLPALQNVTRTFYLPSEIFTYHNDKIIEF